MTLSKRLTPAQKAHLEDLALERRRLEQSRLHDKLNEIGCLLEIVLVMGAVTILNLAGVSLLLGLVGAVVSYIGLYVVAFIIGFLTSLRPAT